MVIVEASGVALAFRIAVEQAARAPDAGERILRRLRREPGAEKGAVKGLAVGEKALIESLAGQLRAAGAEIESRAIGAPERASWNPSRSAADGTSPSSSARDEKVRVLIVDDSDPVRKLLESVLSADEQIEVVASLGRPSLVEEAVARLKPDVVTLDIHMPEMNGVELLKALLQKRATPAVMISSLSMEEGGFVLDALEAGAVDYVQKPSMKELDVVAPVIREKVKSAAKSKVLRPSRPIASEPRRLMPTNFAPNALIAIGASTGGTEALKRILSSMPEAVPPILIVQHIPPVFSKAFADRMNQVCAFEVREARDGDEAHPSLALIAPGGAQMKARATGGTLRVTIDDSPPVNRHKPSVDVLFDSVAQLKGFHVAAGILTGMGADGAKGLLRLRQAGARTLAQDEATSVVYGMPREAAKIGAAETIAPLDEIAGLLLARCQRKSGAA